MEASQTPRPNPKARIYLTTSVWMRFHIESPAGSASQTCTWPETKSSTQLDRSCEDGVFAAKSGFGRPAANKNVVLTFFDADCPCYFVNLDTTLLKIRYSMEDGLPLGYLLHKNLIARLLRSAYDAFDQPSDGENKLLELRGRLLDWIANILRSPISDALKSWILRNIETQGQDPQRPPISSVNSLVIAYSLCSCCPTGTEEAQFLRRALTETISNEEGISPTMLRFIQRKEQYGIYVVKGGTLFELQALLGQRKVAVRDFEREVTQRAINFNSMYLDIISQFTGFTCIVYVQGLRHVEDALLKWLAEYTRHHPWRFIFFENVDASWNFSENRDRCNFAFAPENPSKVILDLADLESERVSSIRPSHMADYQHVLPADKIKDYRKLLDWAKTELTADFLNQPQRSEKVSDFRTPLGEILRGGEACVVLVVSPPGAGKTFFMDDMKAKEEGRRKVVQFDGSSDILVTHTIVELLNKDLGVHGEKVLLIIDEYHMLADAQKAQLFEWIEEKAAGLQVVLVANRIDSRDKERIQNYRSASLLEARLSRQVLNDKLEHTDIGIQNKEHLRLWFSTSRLVFGEESISLRLVDAIAKALQGPSTQHDLTEILLAKVPTISQLSAEQFVAAFLAKIQQSNYSGLPFAVLFNVAALDAEADSACSYHEFASRMPRSLYSAPPATRLLSWCAYMRSLYPQTRDLPDLATICAHEYVDQIGVPFLLREVGSGNPSRGRAFSWAGDYESIDDIIDALKRGHSVDWQDLHEKVWRKTTITEGEKVCLLLSNCRNPGACLEALKPENLALLLRTTVPSSAVMLAHATLHNDVHLNDEGAPYQEAFWIIVLNDPKVNSAATLAELTDRVPEERLARHPNSQAYFSGVGRGAQTSLLPKLLSCLQWARENSHDHRELSGGLDDKSRQELLRRTLVLATVCSGCDATLQGQLWCSGFAQLLVTPTAQTEAAWVAIGQGSLRGKVIPSAMPVDCLRGWLGLQEAMERSWPQEIKHLWAILRCKAPAEPVINELWESNRPLLLDPGSGTKISTDVVRGMIHNEGGDLNKDIQKAILTSGCKVPVEITDDDVSRVTGTALRQIGGAELPVDMDPRMRGVVENAISQRG
ncbi:unnamed protein product [Polarella glacialis]|uniref:AAA+ ATPase domain-containing protein n=1 Tax=Polarella glacialis TaxID=89957 RepID=A0A813G535_POLGL|nr:unnamed protein product [Polarella glacialis]